MMTWSQGIEACPQTDKVTESPAFDDEHSSNLWWSTNIATKCWKRILQTNVTVLSLYKHKISLLDTQRIQFIYNAISNLLAIKKFFELTVKANIRTKIK